MGAEGTRDHHYRGRRRSFITTILRFLTGAVMEADDDESPWWFPHRSRKIWGKFEKGRSGKFGRHSKKLSSVRKFLELTNE